MVEYRKWDKIVDSDDEEDEKQGKSTGAAAATGAGAEKAAPSSGSYSFGPVEGRIVDRMLVLLREWEGMDREHYVKKGKLKSREKQELVARFLAIQYRGREVDNVHRHREILQMATHDYPELGEMMDTLYEFANIIPRLKSGTQQDVQLVNEGLNSLEAMHLYGPIALFSRICTPKDDESKKLREKYAKCEFAMQYHIAKQNETRSKLAGYVWKDDEDEDESWCTLL